MLVVTTKVVEISSRLVDGVKEGGMRIPKRPPPLDALFQKVGGQALPGLLRHSSATESDGKYRHWDTLRYIKPPEGLTLEEWWLSIKLARLPGMRHLPLRDAENNPFKYSLPDPLLEMLHHIDQRASGKIALDETVANAGTRDQYIAGSLIEEAITSSQLEGAVTTRVVAKEMLQSGRLPRDKNEQMILNNYRAIQFARKNAKSDLTPELLCEMQRIVTEDTLEDPKKAGCFQSPDEPRVSVLSYDGEVVHHPPSASELPQRVQAMCDFANGVTPQGFLHPVLRAITLHFWLAYEHPFFDGNGRTARAVFYWSMLHEEYWMAEYLSISRILKEAPASYGRAFLYTETDDNDLTYFLLYQAKVICRAIEGFVAYLHRKMQEVRDAEALLRRDVALNHRQMALLSHALRRPGSRYTFASHRRSHNVTYQSARTDLLDLEQRGLLLRRMKGRKFEFSPAQDLSRKLSDLTE